MRIKLKYQLVSSALIVLPILVILFSWNRLPNQVPLHFDEQGQVDEFGTRQQWMTRFFWAVLLFSFIRIVFLHLVGRQANLLARQRVLLYLLTSGFMAGGTLLLIGQGFWGISLYREWMPVLFFLFGSGFVYYGVPPDLPAAPEIKPPLLNRALAQQLENRQRIHTVSRLVTVRVNLLAVLLMLFVSGKDRWSVGILANLLAYVYLAGLSVYWRRNID